MKIYRIRDWSKHFENNRTKELKKMAWVPMPVKHDGDGYTQLVDHDNGSAHFGVWCFLVELAAKCDPRGTLVRMSQEGAAIPHDPATFSRLSRMKVRDFEEAIPRLTQIGWLEEVTEIPQEPATLPQEGAGIPQEGAASRVRARARAGTTQNNTEGNGTTPPTAQSEQDEEETADGVGGGENVEVGSVGDGGVYEAVDWLTRVPKLTASHRIREAITSHRWTIDELKEAWRAAVNAPKVRDRKALLASWIISGTRAA